LSVADFENDLQEALDENRELDALADFEKYKRDGVSVYYGLRELLVVPPELSAEWNQEHPYDEKHRSKEAKAADDQIPLIMDWLTKSKSVVTSSMTPNEKASFIKNALKFFVDSEGRLYRRAVDSSSQHRLFVPKDRRMWMLIAAHDNFGHKGMFATRALIEKRFWWPRFDEDVDWFVKSCQECQNRRLELLKIPPVITHTPSLFQKIHIDVIKVSPASNGCKNIVHGRCALSNWSEGRALRAETARALAEWFFEDILCRWGCPEEIVTDNASQMIAMTDWLRDKYGIRGIRVSSYNSQANGKIERAHFDIRQALAKAASGDLTRWYWFLKPILWADRVTT
jgi:hypothetical protein